MSAKCNCLLIRRRRINDELASLVELVKGQDVNAYNAVSVIPGRVQQAIERAAKLLEPKVRSVAIERATLRNEEDVNQRLTRQKTALLQALKEGPVLIQ